MKIDKAYKLEHSLILPLENREIAFKENFKIAKIYTW